MILNLYSDSGWDEKKDRLDIEELKLNKLINK
jgi:hypothetical protein